MDIGDKIKYLRTQHGLTLEDVGKAVGVGKSTVRKWEVGEISNMRRDKIANLAKVLHTTPAYLMGWDDNPSPNPLPSNAIPYEPTGFAPILGSIPAGYPVMAMECIEGYAPVNRANPEEYFWLRVNGTSMINAGIVNGDLVLIHRQPNAEDKQIVACRVNGDEATLKRFIIQGDTVILMPENPDYSPKVVSLRDFDEGRASIIGVAVTVQREL